VLECEPERDRYEVGAICRRRKGSFGSVSETLRLRVASWVDSWVGGGRREDRRIGGSSICVGSGQVDLRVGDVVFGMLFSSRDNFLCSSCRSAEAKFRAERLSGGVESPEAEGRMMVFLQASQIPEE
jgi:hypothetical protein